MRSTWTSVVAGQRSAMPTAFAPHGRAVLPDGAGQPGAGDRDGARSLPDVRTGFAVDTIEHRRRRGDRAVRAARGASRRRRRGGAGADRGAGAVPPSAAGRSRVGLAELRHGRCVEVRGRDEAGPPARSRQSTRAARCGAGARTATDGRARRCVASFAGSSAAQECSACTRGGSGRGSTRSREMNPDLTFEGEPVMYAWADDPYTLGRVLGVGRGVGGAARRVHATGRAGGVRGRAHRGRRSPRHDGGRAASRAAARPSRCSRAARLRSGASARAAPLLASARLDVDRPTRERDTRERAKPHAAEPVLLVEDIGPSGVSR